MEILDDTLPLLDENGNPLLDGLSAEVLPPGWPLPTIPPPRPIPPTLWSWATFDARTYTPTGSIPMKSWQHDERLSAAGSWSAEMQPPRTALLGRAALDGTEPGKCTVVPLRNGVPLNFDGFVGPGGRDVPHLAGANVTSTLDLRVFTSTRTYAAVDQLALLADLVNYCAATAGLLVDTTRVGTSDVLITQTWSDYELKNIGQAIRDKASGVNGFDWDIRTEILSGVPTRVLRAWWPRRGRYYIDQLSPVFVVGGNVRNFPPIVASNTFRTEAVGAGKETDPTTQSRLFATASSDLLSEGYLTMTATVNQKEAGTLGDLQAAVDGAMRLNSSGASVIGLDVDPNDQTWPWGSWDLGDECRVVVPAGLSVWWPDGYSEIRRIIAHSWTFDAATGEKLRVTTGRA